MPEGCGPKKAEPQVVREVIIREVAPAPAQTRIRQ